jgi:hypothetical protein
MRTNGVRWQDCGLRARLLWAPLRVKGHRSSIVGASGRQDEQQTRQLTSLQGPWSNQRTQRDERAVMAAAVAEVAAQGSRSAAGQSGSAGACEGARKASETPSEFGMESEGHNTSLEKELKVCPLACICQKCKCRLYHHGGSIVLVNCCVWSC